MSKPVSSVTDQVKVGLESEWRIGLKLTLGDPAQCCLRSIAASLPFLSISQSLKLNRGILSKPHPREQKCPSDNRVGYGASGQPNDYDRLRVFGVEYGEFCGRDKGADGARCGIAHERLLNALKESLNAPSCTRESTAMTAEIQNCEVRVLMRHAKKHWTIVAINP